MLSISTKKAARKGRPFCNLAEPLRSGSFHCGLHEYYLSIGDNRLLFKIESCLVVWSEY